MFWFFKTCKKLKLFSNAHIESAISDISVSGVSSTLITRFSICGDITDKGMESIVSGLPNIFSLTIESRLITDETANFISKYCPNLKSLKIRSENLTDQTVLYLASGITFFILVTVTKKLFTYLKLLFLPIYKFSCVLSFIPLKFH